MNLFQKKYRVESARLTNWDYSSPGYYFITICTVDRGCIFGEIISEFIHRDAPQCVSSSVLKTKMNLNETGKIVNDEWIKSFEIRPEFKQDEFIVMPNHFHAIVQIAGSGNAIETHGGASLQRQQRQQQQRQPKQISGIAHRVPRSISSMIAGFKSAATKRINELRTTPGVSIWQPRFHDHIIRNERELFTVRRYIRNNPENWERDRNVIEFREENPLNNQGLYVYHKNKSDNSRYLNFSGHTGTLSVFKTRKTIACRSTHHQGTM
jgi:putative transposase